MTHPPNSPTAAAPSRRLACRVPVSFSWSAAPPRTLPPPPPHTPASIPKDPCCAEVQRTEGLVCGSSAPAITWRATFYDKLHAFFSSRFFGCGNPGTGWIEVNTGTHRTEASHTAQAQSLVIPESCNEALVCVEALSDILMLATSAGAARHGTARHGPARNLLTAGNLPNFSKTNPAPRKHAWGHPPSDCSD